MRTLLLSLSALVAATTLVSATAIPGAAGGAKKYSLNNAVGKNAIEFVSEAPVEKINGTADGVQGAFTLDAANLEATSGKIDVAVLTMKTANSKRDEHMYDAMWLDAAKYPTITFDIKSLKDVKVATKDGRSVVTATAVGSFTCHGVTKPTSASVTITYLPESADTKKRASGNLAMIEATFNVGLADHNITGKAGVVGKSVGETIAVTAKLFSNS
ncbi:MAG: YceI family protein [Candidatus Kapabacteria bacterium]|nr:YceI family protein [Candidatus Kapabacteria bacterium]